jgi:DNA primase
MDEVVAFGGRLLEKSDFAKYKNTKETLLFNKSKTLYNINLLKKLKREQPINDVIFVEGYMDTISLYQAGFRNVVASMGTALTKEQARLVKRYSENVLISYDGDGAGIHAALRGIGLVLKEGMNVKVVLLPDGQDPDDFAKKHTLEEVQDYIAENERDFIGFKTDLLLDDAGNDPLKRAELINDIADTVALIPDAVKRAVYVRTCAARFEIDEQILAERISRTRSEMIMADKKQEERERQRAAAQRQAPAYPQGQPVSPPDDVPPPAYDDYADYGDYADPVSPVYDVPQTQGTIVENAPAMAPCEKELLGFILEEGCTDLQFDIDSKYYVEGEVINVAEFIDGILADDDATFVNQSFRNVYDEYFRMYDEGLTQQQIQTRLLNSMDEEIAAVARELLIEKYQITVKSYEQSLTATSTKLIQFIPKALLAYQCKKVELLLKDLTTQLAVESDPERQVEILAKIGEYNKARTRLNNELGRV